MIAVPRPRLVPLGVFLIAVAMALVFTLPLTRAAINGVFDPTVVAAPSELAVQRGAAERGLERAYRKGLDQLEQTKKLKLSLPKSLSDSIANKASEDLKALRRNGLVTIAQLTGLRDPALSAYVLDAEPRLGTTSDLTQAELLLAPQLFAIVQKMDEVVAQIADDATRKMTVPGTGASPSPSPSPSAGR